MTCKEFEALLPHYPDDMPDEAAREAFLAHAASCPGCAELLAEQEALLAALSTLDEDTAVPAHTAARWRAAVEAEASAASPARRPWLARWQGLTTVAAALLLVIGGTAMMRQGLLPMQQGYETVTPTTPPKVVSFSTTDLLDEAEVPIARGVAKVAGSGASDDAAMDEGIPGEADIVLLQSADVTLSTGDMDETIRIIDAALDSAGGWAAYRAINGEAAGEGGAMGRTATLQLRVPQDALGGFLNELYHAGRVLTLQQATENITTRYQDTQGRLAQQEAQRDRLVALLAEAADMADILLIEQRLSEVQYTIESLTGRLESWQSLRAYATVDVSIREEAEAAAVPLGARIAAAFAASWREATYFLGDMLVFLVMAAPYLVCAVLVIAVVCTVWRTYRRHRQQKHDDTQ